MKIEKVTYQKTYSIGPYLTDRVGFEASISDKSLFDETPESVLSELSDMADAWHRKAHPHLYEEKNPVSSEVFSTKGLEVHPRIGSPVVIDYKKFEELEKAIDDAQTIEVLKVIKAMQSAMPPHILQQYNTKMEILRIEANNKEMGEKNSIIMND